MMAMMPVMTLDWKLARFFRYRWFSWYLLGLFMVVAWFCLTQNQLGIIGNVAMYCFAFDVIFIAAIRWMLRWSSSMDHFGKIAGVVLINLMLGLILVVAPMRAFEVWHRPTLFYVAMGNIVVALASVAFVVLGFTMLAHKLLWPMINRPLYSLQDLGIRRKLLGVAGVALLTYAGWALPELLKKVIEILAG
jgi:hypothetical protein